MLKTLMVGTAIAVGISAMGTGAVLAQTLRKPAPADTPRLLLIDHKEKHKNKHVNRHGDDAEDRDEDEDRGRRSSSRTSRSSSSSSQGYYGSSPYGAPRGYGGYGYYDQPPYGYYPPPSYGGYGWYGR